MSWWRPTMRVLKFKVNQQKLEKDPSCDFSDIIQGSKNYLCCDFVFDKNLQKYRKVACFINDRSVEYVPIINDRCFVPDSVAQGDVINFFITFVDKEEQFDTNQIYVRQVTSQWKH